MAASATNGVARRTESRVREKDCKTAPGTPDASPPLAGWKVRRAQSLSADQGASAALTTIPPSRERHPLTSVPSSLLGEGRSKQATLRKLPALPRLSHL